MIFTTLYFSENWMLIQLGLAIPKISSTSLAHRPDNDTRINIYTGSYQIFE